MKITFEADEIKEILINYVKAMGLQGNTVDYDAGYSRVTSATVSFVKPEVEDDTNH